ncbi:unnamed protein product [Malus baccata var. baccata]
MAEAVDEESVRKFVAAYLKKKGFKQTENAFQDELNKNTNSSSSPISFNSKLGSDVAKHILSFSQYSLSLSFFSHFHLWGKFRTLALLELGISESYELVSSRYEEGPAQYQDAYAKLRSWTYSSLDLYRHELLRVLYPVFIHCFMDLVAKGHIQEARTFFNSFRENHKMMHQRDLQKLEGVLSPSPLEEMEFAHSLRQSKVNIKKCQYSYELLLQFLHKSQSATVLGIINEHINFQVSPGQPSSISDDAEALTLTGSSLDSANQINQKEIHWGGSCMKIFQEFLILLKDSLEERLDKAGALDSERAEGESKEGDGDENKKKLSEGAKQGASNKKLKKDKAAGAAKSARPEATPVTAVPRVKPELTLPVISTEVEHSILEDLRNRVQLSSAALPSVSFYTFINMHNGLNCSSISHDGSMVAGGFSDSSLKVWDMAKIGQQGLDSALQVENGTTTSSEQVLSNGGKKPYTLFQGHSGPVYSATFNPLGDFILSSSADSTVRLSSTKLNANLVCYKGHNYPAWDVQFSPVGPYFASASHDRTARIWSMDRIQPLTIMAGHLSDVDCVQWHVN